MSENLLVFLRIKPSDPPSPFKILSPQSLLLPPNKLYPFDKIFPASSSQSAVFKDSCEPLIVPFLSGYNCTYFVNGQTGTGKTHTMGLLNKLKPGLDEHSGLVPHFLRNLFASLAQNDIKTEILISFFQIYCDEVRDLLNPEAKGLVIREKKDSGETFIRDLVETPVGSLEEAYKIVNAGLVFRKMGSQKMNMTSSRSHTILTIYQKHRENASMIESSFSFVDLAGSERVKKSNSNGKSLDEARNINASLAALANVISALSKQSSEDLHVPFRDNKLTRVLQGSLSGKAKIVLLATVSDKQEYLNESLGTLNFAMRCRGVSVKPLLQTFDIEEHRNFDEIENDEVCEEKREKFEDTPEQPKNHEENSKGEILATFLIKLLRGMRKLIKTEGPMLRDSTMRQADYQERLRVAGGPLRFNFSNQLAALSGFCLKELQFLDKKYPFFDDYPKDSDLFTNDFNEEKLKAMDFDDIIGKIQKIADFLVRNIKVLSKEVEDMKHELVVARMLRSKREEELENWSKGTTMLLRGLLEKQQECIRKEQPTMSVIEFERKSLDYERELNRRLEAEINRNQFYEDLDFLRERLKVIKTGDYSHKIRDFSLMESLKTLQKYSSNREGLSNQTNNSGKEEDGNAISEILKREEGVSRGVKGGENMRKLEIPMLNLHSPVKEVAVSLGELAEIKKQQKRIEENNERKAREKTPESAKVQIKKQKTLEVQEKEKEQEQESPKINLNQKEKRLILPHLLDSSKSGERSPNVIQTPPKKNLNSMIKILEKEVINEMKEHSDNFEQNLDEIPKDDSRIIENSERNAIFDRKKTEFRNKPILAGSEIKSIFDRNSIRTRNNTIMLKDRGSTLGKSPKSPGLQIQGSVYSIDNVKKKSEITDLDSLETFMKKNMP